MAHIKVVIDGQTVVDGDAGYWSANPPEILEQQLRDNARPALWMRALLLCVADAAMTNRDCTIEVTTHSGGWKLATNDRG